MSKEANHFMVQISGMFYVYNADYVPFTGFRIYCAPTDTAMDKQKNTVTTLRYQRDEITQRRLENMGMIVTAESEELLHDVIPNNCTASLDNLLEGLRKKPLLSGFSGLEVTCWPSVPKFAGSHSAEAVGFLGRKKSLARPPSEGK